MNFYSTGLLILSIILFYLLPFIYVNRNQLIIPAPMAVGAVHHKLIDAGLSLSAASKYLAKKKKIKKSLIYNLY